MKNEILSVLGAIILFIPLAFLIFFYEIHTRFYTVALLASLLLEMVLYIYLNKKDALEVVNAE